MTRQAWTVPALLAGLVLTLAGPWLAGVLIPEQAVWSNEDARALNEAQARMHGSLHESGAKTGAAQEVGGQRTADATTQDAADQESRRNTLLARRTWLIMGTRVLGILLAAAGIVGYLVTRH